MLRVLKFEKTLYSTAKTCVLWDVMRRPVPTRCKPHLISQNITSALSMMDIKGEVTIYAYGDKRKIPKSAQKAFNNTGIIFKHIPDLFLVRVSSGNGGLETTRLANEEDVARHRRMVISTDMEEWKRANHPPANFLVISDDSCGFQRVLHNLWDSRGYNIVLDYPTYGPPAERDLLVRGILGGGLTSSIVSNLGNCCCEVCKVPGYSSSK